MVTRTNKTMKSLDKKKTKELTEIELLKQQVTMLKNVLCTCPNNGTFVGCPIHGEKMYGDMWRLKNYE